MGSGLADFSLYLKAFTSLLAMVDPPFVIPLFLQIVAGRSPEDRARIALIGTIGFLVATLIFVFSGELLLRAFGISVPAFQLAGGLLLMLLALDMLKGGPSLDAEGGDSTPVTLGLVPLAIPVLAGPGALSTAVLFSAQHDGFAHDLALAGVIIVLGGLVLVMLRLASMLEPYMTHNVQLVFNKIMGLIVAAIAFEFIMHGIGGHFPGVEMLDH